MDPVAELLARDQHGIKFGLDSIRTLCAALDHPETAWPSLIVAGTNGKGSVTAMVAAVLTAAGHRTGRYTSPHLVDVVERVAIDGSPITHAQLGDAARRTLAAEAGCLAQGSLSAPTTFFEITTAAAFEAFRQARADVVVLEVGMGGRFDATNAADPLAGAITSIDLDHTRFLGSTLGAIAFEKAGIARAGRPLIVGPMPDEAASVIDLVARDRGARLLPAFAGVTADAAIGADGLTRLALRTPRDDYGTFTLGLRGRHQVANAVVAVRLLEAASERGLPITASAVVAGLSTVTWPARLERLELAGGKEALLDAAHNPAGTATLAAYLTDIGAPPCPIVFGAMRDKDVGPMVRTLGPHASRFVFCQAHSARAMPADELLAQARAEGVPVPMIAVAAPAEALELALRAADRIVIAGSIFLIGDLAPELAARRHSRS